MQELTKEDRVIFYSHESFDCIYASKNDPSKETWRKIKVGLFSVFTYDGLAGQPAKKN